MALAPDYSIDAGAGLGRSVAPAPANYATSVTVYIEYGAEDRGYEGVPAKFADCPRVEQDYAGTYPACVCDCCRRPVCDHIWQAVRRTDGRTAGSRGLDYRVIDCDRRRG
jgi:hypothetical protein